MGAALALLTLVLSASAAFGQRRGTFLEPRRAGAFEMGGTSLLSLNAEGNLMVDAGLEVTVLGRAAGPLHSGVRLGVGLLDRTGSLAGTEDGTQMDGKKEEGYMYCVVEHFNVAIRAL